MKKVMGYGVLILVLISVFQYKAFAEETKTEVIKLIVVDLDCGSCAKALENSLKRIENIMDASIHIDSGEALITIIEGAYTAQNLIEIVAELGYEAYESEKDN